jgi:hypothetical protein
MAKEYYMNTIKRWAKPRLEVENLPDGARLYLKRDHKVEDIFRLGPNEVSAMIFHEDGSVTDLGITHNLLTNSGRDLVAAGLGTKGPAANTATGTSATSLTDTGESWTTDQFKGWTVFAEESTNNPVFGNIGSNSGTVLTLDQWWGPDDATETTPGSTCDYIILPTCRPRFMALTENAGAASASDTVLTGEITSGGASRAVTTYAHTGGTATFTLQKSYSITASFPAIHKMGLFTASTSTAAGIMVFETVLNADANVINGDTLQVTDTVTIS